MERKTKFLLFGLAGGIIICFVLLVQTLLSKQQLVRERDDLQKEKVSLESKLSSLETSIRSYENKITSLNKDLTKVNQEKEDLQSKFDLANKAKEDLLERLKETSSLVSKAPAKVQAAAPQANDAYWAGILQAKLELEMQLANVRNELKSTEIANEQLERDKGALDLEIKSLKREAEDTKRQMEYDKKIMAQQLDDEKKTVQQQLENNKRVMDRISQDLVIEKNDKMRIQEGFRTVKNENAALIRQIESLSSRKAELEQRLKQIQEDKAGLERKFKDMEVLLTNNISQVNDLKEKLEGRPSGIGSGVPEPVKARAAQRKDSVELPPIVVRPQGAGITLNRPVPVAAPHFPGKIIATNKEGNFVIIDLGEEVGIKMGDAFTVYRDTAKIGAIEVIKISRTVSACDIKKQVSPIKVGDLIK
jgi:uncharacterized protein YfcZ (UPF0381/DUF406 family)